MGVVQELDLYVALLHNTKKTIFHGGSLFLCLLYRSFFNILERLSKGKKYFQTISGLIQDI